MRKRASDFMARRRKAENKEYRMRKKREASMKAVMEEAPATAASEISLTTPRPVENTGESTGDGEAGVPSVDVESTARDAGTNAIDGGACPDRDTRGAASRPQRCAPPHRTRPRTEKTARSTAQKNTAPSVEPPGSARVHVSLDTGGRAATLLALAPPLQTRVRMEATVQSTASMVVLLVDQPVRASANANLGTRV